MEKIYQWQMMRSHIKVKLTVKDGKYYVTLNLKAMNIPFGGQTFHGYLNKDSVH